MIWWVIIFLHLYEIEKIEPTLLAFITNLANSVVEVSDCHKKIITQVVSAMQGITMMYDAMSFLRFSDVGAVMMYASLPLAIYPVIALGTLGLKQCNTGINARMSSAQYSVRSMSIGAMSVGGATQCKVKTWKSKNLSVKRLEDIPATLANPSKIRDKVYTHLNSKGRSTPLTIATASVKINGTTKYYLAVNGADTWNKREPTKLNLNGNDYNVIEKSPDGTATFPRDNGQTNNNHSEHKLMGYIENKYSGQNAKVDMAIENNSKSSPGMCEACIPSSKQFAKNNSNFEINIYHGSTRTTE